MEMQTFWTLRHRWQQIIYVDFDNRPRQRELIVQIMGEG